ncbi:MAG: TonB-dependent receptor, partial [Pseudomonadota bacterium]
NIYAGYALANLELSDAFTLNLGVRVEVTDFDAQGFLVQELDDSTIFFGDLVTDSVAVVETNESNNYTDVLPAISARFEATDDLILRAAYSRTLARPTIGQAVPSSEIEIDDEDEVVGAFVGNPDLDRQLSDNIDASFDYYVSDSFIISGGVFYKSFTDFIATVAFEDGGTAFGIEFDEIEETAININDADLIGFEVSAEKVFSGLPAPFDGLLVGGNFTYVDGEATFGGRTIPLPQLSETLGSLVVGYDKYGLDLRAALSYRDERLDNINEGGEGIDRFIDDNIQLDITAKYDLTDQLTLTAEAQNVTNEPFEAFLQLPDGRRGLSQFEEYGVTYRFGLRYTY